GLMLWWAICVAFDTLAFVPQALFGALCEKFPGFRPGLTGGILITSGALIMLLSAAAMTGKLPGGLMPGDIDSIADMSRFIVFQMAGLILLTAGNALIHVSGALVTLRVSEGRLSESALFVGGGSFGVITGRLLAGTTGTAWLPFLLIAAATVVMVVTDRRVRHAAQADGKTSGTSVFDFDAFPCAHDIAANRPAWLVITVLFAVVAVRAYIGYGIPTAWNKTSLQTLFLFLFMGIGKILGGILSDLFGARRLGIISCLLAVPLLLVSDNIMWLSLIAVALFSMTMAVTLGGLVSVLKNHPGVAFGITTIALWLGSMPVFLFGIPEQTVCNILIASMSVLAAAGLFFVLNKRVIVRK
ncbi:MAG: hypothetical protein J6U61_11320, partial [Lachnospiraceae bacterium]|nr:hypothetical protein [Lachnospiraceae bacterium]